MNLKDIKVIIGSASKEDIFIFKDESNFKNIIRTELNKEFDGLQMALQELKIII